MKVRMQWREEVTLQETVEMSEEDFKQLERQDSMSGCEQAKVFERTMKKYRSDPEVEQDRSGEPDNLSLCVWRAE